MKLFIKLMLVKGNKLMKVLVKAPFFDEKGIHKRGEIAEVSNFRPEYMELLPEGKAEKVETAEKKEPAKTTRRKKG